MDRVDITLNLNLPEELVEKARSAGLLTQDQIERWLREELERQSKLKLLFNNLDRLSSLEPPLSEDEIDAEIDAYRKEKRRTNQDEDL